MSFKQDLINNIFHSQSNFKTTAAFIVNKLFFSCNKIFIYTKHIYNFLGNICKHLVFVFWRQTNFGKFTGNPLCQSLFFIKVA